MGKSRPDSFTNPETGETFRLNEHGTIIGLMPAEPANIPSQQSLDKFDLSQLAVSADTKTLSEQLGFANTAGITPTTFESPKFDKPAADPLINRVNGNTFAVGTVGNSDANIKFVPVQTGAWGKFDDPNVLKIIGNLGPLTAETNFAAADGTVKPNQQISPTVGVQFNKTTSLKGSFTPKGSLTQVEGEFNVGSAAVNLGVKGLNKDVQTGFLGVKGAVTENISAGFGVAVDLNTPKINPALTGGFTIKF